jgi:hypothetical protein
MSGFDTTQVHKILGLPDSLVPCAYLAVGSSTPKDGCWPRFRFPITNLIENRD